MLVRTRVASNMSPWLSRCQVGDVHTVAISHGEGRFVADDETLKTLVKNGQVATQYVDLAGEPTMDVRFNPNGSYLAIEDVYKRQGLTRPLQGGFLHEGTGTEIRLQPQPEARTHLYER